MLTPKPIIPAIIVFLLAACGERDAAEDLAAASEGARAKVDKALSQEPPQTIGEAIERAGTAIADGEQSVSAADLKTLLPAKLAGLERVSHEAERAGIGVKVSKARAEYGRADRRVSLMITDLGAVSGLARMGMELFQSEVDREDESGFERTTEYKGHRSYQRLMRHEDQSLAEIMVFVDDRFTVQLDGQNIDWDTMIDALDDVELGRLQSLRQATAK